jgi:hypothetical protein
VDSTTNPQQIETVGVWLLTCPQQVEKLYKKSTALPKQIEQVEFERK